MKKTLLFIGLVFATLLLVGCNPAGSVKHNIGKEAENFNTYRRITVYNLLSDKVLLEVEGYISTHYDHDYTRLSVVIKTGEDEFKMHYVHIGAHQMGYIVEQLENTSSDPYSWKIRVYVTKPDIVGKED